MMNNPQSGVYATCLSRGAGGQFWAGSQGEGLFRRDAGGKWAPFAGAKELGSLDVTCVTVDGARRVWVGTASAGISVFTGGKWTRFSPLDGPLAARVNALVAADDGSVWGATDAGVFHWSEARGWDFPGVFDDDQTVREMARRPVYALALDSTGRVLCATDDGLNRLSLDKAGRASFEPLGRAASPAQPVRAQGEGFLPGPVHAVALDGAGRVWCATRWGVCVRDDDNSKWTFLRGRDWQDNVRGSAIPLKPEESKATVDLLAEDWVTTLAATPDGKMWIGFRSRGAEERDAKTREVLVSTQDDPKSEVAPVFSGNWVSAILPFAADQAVLARFGGGLAGLFGSDLPLSNAQEDAQSTAIAPQPATFGAEQLQVLTQKLDKRAPLAVGGGAFYALDRQTRGDWPLRYGNAGIELFGMDAHESRQGMDAFQEYTGTGPHRAGAGEDCYVFTSEPRSLDPNAVQVPSHNVRTRSEINDGTWQDGKYPPSFDGPDLWISFFVPAGLFRVAPYWFNNTERDGLNRLRDHRVLLYEGASPQACLGHEPLAKARLWSGGNGEYATFAVRGPGLYQMRIARDRSHGTVLEGLFFDRLGQSPTRPAWLPATYALPLAPDVAPDAPFLAAVALWQACDRAESRGVPAPLERLVALRAAKTLGAPAALLRAWRVQAGAWDEHSTDREDVALPGE